jgi:beta-lactamase superfamily II metal-dependent hydrolase
MAAAKAKKRVSGSKRKAAKKTKQRVPKAAKAKKAARTKKSAKTPPRQPAPGASVPAPAASGGDPTGLRVRMYRVGFGDFFLLSVPSATGAKHILIDCGVHAVDLGSIGDAVAQMAEDCGKHLSLVIMTHRHADHISGFGKCADAFSEFTVDRVWMPWFEDPANDTAKSVQKNLTAMASQLALRLAVRGPLDPHAHMVNNITGGMAASGVSANQKALDVLHKGFKNPQPAPGYYRAGDQPNLPQELIDAGLSAQILGPPGDLSLITQMTNVNDQYLTDSVALDDETGKASPAASKIFPAAFNADASVYPASAFRFFGSEKVKALIDTIQPDVLAAQALAADKTLNNQSLVILFSFKGKNLLFVGDAQWGNWENFLYGGAFGTPGHTKMTAEATQILNNIDFYKVGHHGSRNATPKDAVAAMMRLGCACMCSTQIKAYNEVPREPLMQALSAQMKGKLARSDQVAVKSQGPNAAAGPLPQAFKTPTEELFIDYNF